jgi:hypothetical protein
MTGLGKEDLLMVRSILRSILYDRMCGPKHLKTDRPPEFEHVNGIVKRINEILESEE